MSGGDPARAQQILDWPLREVVLAYSERMKKSAEETYKFELLMWQIRTAFSGGSEPPSMPEILRER